MAPGNTSLNCVKAAAKLGATPYDYYLSDTTLAELATAANYHSSSSMVFSWDSDECDRELPYMCEVPEAALPCYPPPGPPPPPPRPPSPPSPPMPPSCESRGASDVSSLALAVWSACCCRAMV